MTISYNSDPRYAHAKLAGSVVRYKDDPVMVEAVHSHNDVSVYKVQGGMFSCRLNDLNLEPVPLGYVNHSRGSTYTLRVPARYWRQGLRDSTLHVLGPTARRTSALSHSMVRCIKNIYPTIRDCVETVFVGEVLERAFCREFSIYGKVGQKKQHLMYKGMKVGHVEQDGDGFAFKFDEGKDYLEEILQEKIDEKNS